MSEFKETPSKVVLVLGAGDAAEHLARLPKLFALKTLGSSVLSMRLFYQLTAHQGMSNSQLRQRCS